MSDIPKDMKAAVLVGHGGYDKLVIYKDWSVPIPEADEVLVQVSACGINNTDINTRCAWYDEKVSTGTANGAEAGFEGVNDDSTGSWGGTGITFPRIQGADIAGKVVAVGSSVSPEEWIGKRVIADPWLRDWDDPTNLHKCGFIGSETDGGFAEYVALPVVNLYRVDCSWTDAELATLACSYTTAENMLIRAGVSEKDVVLVTGASGGVGSALVQLCKVRGAYVIAVTTGSKADMMPKIGADAVIRRGEDDWNQVISKVATKLKRNAKVSVVADVVGAPVFDKVLSVLDRGGRYVTSGAIGGKKVQLDVSKMYLQDWSLIGCTVTTAEVFPNLVRYVEQNQIRPILSACFHIDDIQKAQEEFLKKVHVGKIVIKL